MTAAYRGRHCTGRRAHALLDNASARARQLAHVDGRLVGQQTYRRAGGQRPAPARSDPPAPEATPDQGVSPPPAIGRDGCPGRHVIFQLF